MTTQHTDDATEDSSETVTVAIYYTVGGHRRGAERLERGDEALELARDLRSFADPDDVSPDVFETAYEQMHEGELPVGDILVEDGANEKTILNRIFRRMQGGRVDEELGYDGSDHRSMQIGDIIAIDGVAYMVGTTCTFPTVGYIDNLRGDGAGGD